MSDNLYAENIMGLHSFTNPQDAWNVMCTNWGRGYENMVILDDKRFCQTIVERAIIAIVGTSIGKYSEDWLNDALLSEIIMTDYLIHYNFFYYSEVTRKFYTSIVEIGDFCYLGNFTEEEMSIINDLYFIHDVDHLIRIAFEFVSDNFSLFELYSKGDVIDAFSNLYWECVA